MSDLMRSSAGWEHQRIVNGDGEDICEKLGCTLVEESQADETDCLDEEDD